MIELIKLFWLAYHAYKAAKEHNGTAYAAIAPNDVPQLCVFVGVGREAWRVSQRAIQEMKP